MTPREILIGLAYIGQMIDLGNSVFPATETLIIEQEGLRDAVMASILVCRAACASCRRSPFQLLVEGDEIDLTNRARKPANSGLFARRPEISVQ